MKMIASATHRARTTSTAPSFVPTGPIIGREVSEPSAKRGAPPLRAVIV
jgi:hypothetical protein